MGIQAFIEKITVQTAVYWASPIPDGYGGFTWTAPVEIGVRWEESIKVISDGKGDEVISKAQVLVRQDVDEQGILYLGQLSDLTTTQKANPLLIDTAYTIKRFDKTPMIKSATVFVRKAYL